jgi:hypothetical protein
VTLRRTLVQRRSGDPEKFSENFCEMILAAGD